MIIFIFISIMMFIMMFILILMLSLIICGDDRRPTCRGEGFGERHHYLLSLRWGSSDPCSHDIKHINEARHKWLASHLFFRNIVVCVASHNFFTVRGIKACLLKKKKKRKKKRLCIRSNFICLVHQPFEIFENGGR